MFGNENQLLYVGCSKTPKERIKQHKQTAKWFPDVRRTIISPPLSKEDAAAIEGAAIANESPLYNINGRISLSRGEAYQKRLLRYKERAERAFRLRTIGKETWENIGKMLGVSRQRAQQIGAREAHGPKSLKRTSTKTS